MYVIFRLFPQARREDPRVVAAAPRLALRGRPGARPAGAAPPPRAARRGEQKQKRQQRMITSAVPGANQIQ